MNEFERKVRNVEKTISDSDLKPTKFLIASLTKEEWAKAFKEYYEEINENKQIRWPQKLARWLNRLANKLDKM